MKFYYFFFLAILLSCDHQQSQAEKDYIKNLEAKNRQLENDLQTERNKPPVVIERQADPVYIPVETQSNSKNSSGKKDYFTIGSTEDEVLDVMGDPDNIMDYEILNKKTFSYGLSSVDFSDGKVKSYRNFDGNLKVKARRD